MTLNKRPEPDLLLDSSGSADMGINATANASTAEYEIMHGRNFAIAYKATSGGTIALRVELLQGIKSGGSFVEAENTLDIDANLADSNLHISDWVGVTSPYIKIKATGLSGNAATTKIRSWIITQ